MLQPRLALTTKSDPENTISSISVKTEWYWLVLLFIYFSDGEYLKNSWYNICRNISDPKCGHDWKLLKKNLIILLFLWSFTWVANITCNKNIENGWFYFNQCIYFSAVENLKNVPSITICCKCYRLIDFENSISCFLPPPPPKLLWKMSPRRIKIWLDTSQLEVCGDQFKCGTKITPEIFVHWI